MVKKIILDQEKHIPGRNLFIYFLVIFSISFAALVDAPYLPHTISGYIFLSNGSQVPLGTDYMLNNTNISDTISSQTSIPIPGLSGIYFEVINGTEGDIIDVMAWNSTHYGLTSVTLIGDMDNVNVTINTTRSAELNVTITFPVDDYVFDTGVFYNVTALIKAVVADAKSCNATIAFSDDSIINISITDNLTHNLGDISVGSIANTFWNISALSVGYTNITVSAMCANETPYLIANKQFTVFDILVNDTEAPIVRLISPGNLSAQSLTRTVVFEYNVSDASDLLNCTLVINGAVNQTNSTPIVKDQTLNFTQQLENGEYNWYVNCTDFFGNKGHSGTFYFNVSYYPPYFTAITMTSPINLLSASTVLVTCNATVVNEGGVSNILKVNATLFESAASSADDADDNNYHYSDSDCVSIENGTNEMNVTCQFNMYYYANDGNWMCNISVFTKLNLTNSSNTSSLVEELYAIGVDSIADYGGITPGTLSDELNMTLYNYGNKDIGVTVEGYGAAEEDNLSMACAQGGNISIDSERYSVVYSQAFSSMENLTAYPVQITSLLLSQRTDDMDYGNSTNQTFWKISVPMGIRGSCNGTIIFGTTMP